MTDPCTETKLTSETEKELFKKNCRLCAKLGGNAMKIKALSLRLNDALVRIEELETNNKPQPNDEKLLLDIEELTKKVNMVEDTCSSLRAQCQILEDENAFLRVAANKPMQTPLIDIQIQLLEKDIGILELSTRAYNVLTGMKIETIRDLVLKRETDFRKRRNCGRKTVWNIKNALKLIGLQLDMGNIIAANASSKGIVRFPL